MCPRGCSLCTDIVLVSVKADISSERLERIHTHGNHLVLAMIASGKFLSASDFCNKRQSDGNDPHNMRLAGKIELAMKNASYILQLIANCGQKSHVLFPWMYIWSTHLKTNGLTCDGMGAVSAFRLGISNHTMTTCRAESTNTFFDDSVIDLRCKIEARDTTGRPVHFTVGQADNYNLKIFAQELCKKTATSKGEFTRTVDTLSTLIKCLPLPADVDCNVNRAAVCTDMNSSIRKSAISMVINLQCLDLASTLLANHNSVELFIIIQACHTCALVPLRRPSGSLCVLF
jgi:hypothetical protein